MRLLSLMSAVVVAVGLWAGAAAARDLTAPERAALDRTVTEFTEALSTGDFEAMIAGMPRPVLEVVARRNGITVEETVAAMRAALVEITSGVRFENVTLSSDDFTDFTETPAGLLYAFAPTSFTLSFGAESYDVQSSVLALFDGDEWRLLRIEAESTYEILLEAYPSLEGMPYTPETVTPVE